MDIAYFVMNKAVAVTVVTTLGVCACARRTMAGSRV